MQLVHLGVNSLVTDQADQASIHLQIEFESDHEDQSLRALFERYQLSCAGTGFDPILRCEHPTEHTKLYKFQLTVLAKDSMQLIRDVEQICIAASTLSQVRQRRMDFRNRVQQNLSGLAVQPSPSKRPSAVTLPCPNDTASASSAAPTLQVSLPCSLFSARRPPQKPGGITKLTAGKRRTLGVLHHQRSHDAKTPPTFTLDGGTAMQLEEQSTSSQADASTVTLQMTGLKL